VYTIIIRHIISLDGVRVNNFASYLISRIFDSPTISAGISFKRTTLCLNEYFMSVGNSVLYIMEYTPHPPSCGMLHDTVSMQRIQRRIMTGEYRTEKI
jgi:hypothetical protein